MFVRYHMVKFKGVFNPRLNYFTKYNLKYEINIVEQFSTKELKKAEVYLETDDVSKYEMSIVEFKLCKK